MRRHRVPRPDWASFPGSIVANRENEIHFRSAGNGKLVPALRAEALSVELQVGQKPQRCWMNLALGEAASRIGLEVTLAHAVHERFGKDAASRIPGAEEQHVVGLAHDQGILGDYDACITGAPLAPIMSGMGRKQTLGLCPEWVESGH